MTQIKGQKILTIAASAGEVYAIKYEAPHTLNIINQTDGIISVSEQPTITDNGTVSDCVKLSDGAFVNGLKLDGNTVYITADGSGNISVIRSA